VGRRSTVQQQNNMARRVFHAVVLLQVQVKVSSPRPQLYSNRCGARRMHWRLKQQGIKCMTANGSRLRRFLRAAPSSSQLLYLAAHRGPRQLPVPPKAGPCNIHKQPSATLSRPIGDPPTAATSL
jgi:hypothetical protein